jgi:imidazolonepropionase
VKAKKWAIVRGAAQLYTNEKLMRRKDARFTERDLDPIEDGALVYSLRKARGRDIPDEVLWSGKTRDIPKAFLKTKLQKDLKKRKCLMPGLIDSHAHLVFAGDRSQEFSARCAGATYEELARAGGGIHYSVSATRSATEAELYRLAVDRVRAMAALGIRGIEMKSGYGLDQATEFKQLKVMKRVEEAFPELYFRRTYMGAHAIPDGFTADQWIEEICIYHLPEIVRQGLAHDVDIFVDAGYFGVAHAKKLAQAAAELGLGFRIHADELKNTGAAECAAELRALSADHLLKVSKKGIGALARSRTVATLLPGTAFFLKADHAPARALLDAGVRVAIASDFNPGSCPSFDLPWMLQMAAVHYRMNPAELMASVTINAAIAVGAKDSLGALVPGRRALFTEINADSFEGWLYTLGRWRSS